MVAAQSGPVVEVVETLNREWQVISAKKGALVRAGEGLKSSVVDTLKPGTRVQVLGSATLADGTLRAQLCYPVHGFVSRKCLADLENEGPPARIVGRRAVAVRADLQLHSDEIGTLAVGTECVVDEAAGGGTWKAIEFKRLAFPIAGWVPAKSLGTSFKVLEHGAAPMGSFRDFAMHAKAGLGESWKKNTVLALPGSIRAFSAFGDGPDVDLRRERKRAVDKRRVALEACAGTCQLAGPCCAAPRAGAAGADDVDILRSEDAVRGRASVVCPTYPGRHDLHPLLYACFAHQTWDDKELVVLDTGGAKSPFFSTCDDPRVTYVHNKKDAPTGEKRNALLEMATGEFLAHFDDDNFHTEFYLEFMIGHLRTSGCELVSLSKSFSVWIRSGAVARAGGGPDGGVGPGGSGVQGRGETFVYFKPHRVAEFSNAMVGEEGAFITSQSHHVVEDHEGHYVHVCHGKNISMPPGGNSNLSLDNIPNARLADLIREHRFRFLEAGAPPLGAEPPPESDSSDDDADDDESGDSDNGAAAA